MDFKSGQLIDMLPGRYEMTAQSYFLNIPLEERKTVKYLICEMYKPYINYVKRFFPNCIAIVDSFHVIQLILSKIRQYIRQMLKRYQERDRKALEQKNYKTSSNHKTIRESREVVYLRRYDYFLLKNHDDIDFTAGWRKSKRGEHYYFYSLVYEQRFLTLDNHFTKIWIKSSVLIRNLILPCSERLPALSRRFVLTSSTLSRIFQKLIERILMK